MSANQELIINGQRVHVPTDLEWDDIVRTGRWSGEVAFLDSSKPRILDALQFVRTYREIFSLGLFKAGPWAKEWTLSVLFKQGGAERQVHIERVRCKNCGVTHTIANPAIADFFLASQNKQEALKQAFDESLVRCHKCGARLPRPAIWARLTIE